MAAAGVWVACGSDGAAEAIFTTELLASRFALSSGCSVMFWPFGLDADAAVKADLERKAKN